MINDQLKFYICRQKVITPVTCVVWMESEVRCGWVISVYNSYVKWSLPALDTGQWKVNWHEIDIRQLKEFFEAKMENRSFISTLQSTGTCSRLLLLLWTVNLKWIVTLIVIKFLFIFSIFCICNIVTRRILLNDFKCDKEEKVKLGRDSIEI